MHTAATLAWPPTLRSALTIGSLGGLPTCSSFNYESTRVAQERAPELAAMNGAMTWVGCFVAGWLGMLTARHVSGAEVRMRVPDGGHSLVRIFAGESDRWQRQSLARPPAQGGA